MLPDIDQFVQYKVSVAKCSCNHFTLYILSAQYLRLNGSIAKHVPGCVVALSVALAQCGPIPNCSVDTNVRHASAGTSSVCTAAISVRVCICAGGSCTFAIRHSCKQVRTEEIWYR